MIPHSRPTIEADDLAAVNQVLASGRLAGGREVEAFEHEMATYLGLRGGVATSSGTAALHLALLALGVGPGAEVLIPSYACAALLNAVAHAGAQARLVDCEPGGVNISPEDAVGRRSPAARAVIVPHLFGTVARVEAFRPLCLPIIENCAHAIGATSGGRTVGATGDIVVCSFYATKMITTGEGGMLLSRSEALLEEARDLRDYDKRADHRVRFNYKMTDLQAALGRSQLRKLPRFLERRRAIAGRYRDALGGSAPTYAPTGGGDACYRYVLAVPDPETVIVHLAASGIACARPVHRPLHAWLRQGAFPHAADAYDRAVSVPLYPSLADSQVAAIAAALVAEWRLSSARAMA